MPTRREFLSSATSATVTLLLIPLTECSTPQANPPPTPTDAAPPLDAEVDVAVPTVDAAAEAAPAVPGCMGVGEISSTVADPEAGNALHNHTLCVLTTDLTNPPAGGVTYDTSLSLSHNHTVTLTQAMLQTINSGGSVMVTTSNVAMHTHDFIIMKM